MAFGKMGARGGFGSSGSLGGALGAQITPVDLSGVTVSPAAYYGTTRLSTYSATGACCDVVRSSDSASQTINFKNGTIDMTSALAFAGGANLSISKWYDQSGNGLHATASSNRPNLNAINVINGIQAIGFDGSNNSPVITKQMTLPAGLALNIANNAMFMVGRWSAAMAGTASTVVSLSIAAATAADWKQNVNGPTYIATSTQTQSQYIPSNTLVYGVNEGATPGTTFYVAERTFARAATTGTGTSAGGIIGNNVAGASRGFFEAVALVLFPSALSASDVTALQAALVVPFPTAIQTAFNTTWAFDADSIGLGAGTTFNQNASKTILALLSTPARFINAGIYGQTLASISTAGPSRFAPFKGWSGANLGYVVENSTNDFAVAGTNQALSALPTIAAGGTGYAVSSSFLVTVAGGTGTAATVQVSTNGSGVVTTVSYISGFGNYSVLPSTPNTPTGGTGTGLSLNLTFSQLNSAGFVKGARTQIIANAKGSSGTAITKVGVVTCLPRSSWLAATVTGSITGTVLDVSSVASGTVAVGQSVNYPGQNNPVVITSLGTGAGGIGTYNLDTSLTVASQIVYLGTAAWVQAQISNADVRASPASVGATFLIDVAADSTMGYLGNVGNTALLTDGTHPSSLAWATYLAPIYAAAMNTAYP